MPSIHQHCTIALSCVDVLALCRARRPRVSDEVLAAFFFSPPSRIAGIPTAEASAVLLLWSSLFSFVFACPQACVRSRHFHVSRAMMSRASGRSTRLRRRRCCRCSHNPPAELFLRFCSFVRKVGIGESPPTLRLLADGELNHQREKREIVPPRGGETRQIEEVCLGFYSARPLSVDGHVLG